MNSNLILKNGKPDRYLFNGGYCSYPANPVASSQPTFHYYTKDHLGNNRTVVNENGTLEQVTHYYPFGGIFGDATLNAGIQPYKYNGKELDHVHGLNTYDYGARQYDPILLRWDRIDPLCEKFYSVSPYAYCNNNPAIHIDKDGKVPLVLIGALVGAAIEGGIAYSEGKSTREIKTLKEVEKSEISFAFKTTDYIQQQINAKAGDWITNGVFNKK